MKNERMTKKENKIFKKQVFEKKLCPIIILAAYHRALICVSYLSIIQKVNY
jgi:hypothetical protein